MERRQEGAQAHRDPYKEAEKHPPAGGSPCMRPHLASNTCFQKHQASSSDAAAKLKPFYIEKYYIIYFVYYIVYYPSSPMPKTQK
jgi:hypothetical protein